MTESTLLERVTVANGREIPDAATGEVIGCTADQTAADLEPMIATATIAQRAGGALTPAERGTLLHAAADRVQEHYDELAILLSREQGKPLNGNGARSEVDACIAWLRGTADLEIPENVVIDDGENYAEIIYKPVGLVAAIGPWNWPMMITVWQIAPALKMGNAVVVKPSEYTPLSVQSIVACINEVLPDGVLQVISGGRDVGAAVAAHPAFGKIMFTGSTATGKAIARASAGNLARLTLELGGNDAAIVLPGTDLEKHIDGLFWGAFLNTGQTCTAIKRLYVHESQYDEAVRLLAEYAATAPMGNGLDEANVLGPLQNDMQFDIVKRLVADARDRGATIVTGGSPAAELGQRFFQATIVADAEPGMAIVDEEQFGPVLPVLRYTTVEEAVAAANSMEVGLGGSVWGDDPAAARAVALMLESGMVWINKHAAIHPLIPFGGIKGSGYGLEFGVEGLKAVSVPLVLTSK